MAGQQRAWSLQGPPTGQLGNQGKMVLLAPWVLSWTGSLPSWWTLAKLDLPLQSLLVTLPLYADASCHSLPSNNFLSHFLLVDFCHTHAAHTALCDYFLLSPCLSHSANDSPLEDRLLQRWLPQISHHSDSSCNLTMTLLQQERRLGLSFWACADHGYGLDQK